MCNGSIPHMTNPNMIHRLLVLRLDKKENTQILLKFIVFLLCVSLFGFHSHQTHPKRIRLINPISVCANNAIWLSVHATIEEIGRYMLYLVVYVEEKQVISIYLHDDEEVSKKIYLYLYRILFDLFIATNAFLGNAFCIFYI